MNSYDILREPVITERIHKYTFRVPVTVNKIEVKKAVEEVFGVKVAKVNTIKMLGKVKRMGRYEGRRPSFKKAIVTLAPNSKTIEFFDM